MLTRWLSQAGEPYETFRKHVEQAEAAVEIRALAIVAKSNNPHARLWLLERKLPRRWARAAAEPKAVTSVVFDLAVAIELSSRPGPLEGEQGDQLFGDRVTPR